MDTWRGESIIRKISENLAIILSKRITLEIAKTRITNNSIYFWEIYSNNKLLNLLIFVDLQFTT